MTERGTHQALLSTAGSLYGNLWNAQNSRILNSSKNSAEPRAERLSQKEEERKKLQEEILNSVKGCGNCSCWEKLPPTMFVHPSQMAYTGIPGLRAIGQAGTSPTTPLPTPAKTLLLWLSLLLSMEIKASARQNGGGGAGTGSKSV